MKLPLDCEVDYFSNFLTKEEAIALYDVLINTYRLHESQLTILAGGQLIETDSFKFLFTTQELLDNNSHPESIHGKNYVWSGIMKDLKNKVEDFTGRSFDLAMCLFYPDGNFFAPYHNDQQTSGEDTLLPSISLGEVREFCFKSEIDDTVYSMELEDGSLLLMGKYCQSHYVHSLPKDPKYKKGRINITFREASFQ